jgi:hypothetical protein
MGAALQYEQVSNDLPFTFRAGSAIKLMDRWSASVDVAAPRNDRPNEAFGTEYWIVAGTPLQLAGRVGYNTQTIGSIDGFTGASFGAGFRYKLCDMDYAFVPFGGLGQAHRISLTWRWGTPATARAQTDRRPEVPAPAVPSTSNPSQPASVAPQTPLSSQAPGAVFSGENLKVITDQLIHLRQLLDGKLRHGDVTKAQYDGEITYLAEIESSARAQASNGGNDLTPVQENALLVQLLREQESIQNNLVVH